MAEVIFELQGLIVTSYAGPTWGDDANLSRMRLQIGDNLVLTPEEAGQLGTALIDWSETILEKG